MVIDWLLSAFKNASLVDILAFAIALAAFVLSTIQFLRDNTRQKRESTLLAYNDLQDSVFVNLNILLSENRTQEKDLASLTDNDEKWEEITDYLARIERFSVGINYNIYSIKVLNRLGGGYFIRLFYELCPIISKKREANVSKGNHYDEFEMTVKRLEKMRNK